MPINRPKRVYISITDPDREFPGKSVTVYGETPESAEADIRAFFDRKSDDASAPAQQAHEANEQPAPSVTR